MSMKFSREKKHSEYYDGEAYEYLKQSQFPVHLERLLAFHKLII